MDEWVMSWSSSLVQREALRIEEGMMRSTR